MLADVDCTVSLNSSTPPLTVDVAAGKVYDDVYDGTSHVLSLLKNLVDEVEVPSTADKSIIPVVTAPVALVFTVAAEIYVPFSFVKLATPSSD